MIMMHMMKEFVFHLLFVGLFWSRSPYQWIFTVMVVNNSAIQINPLIAMTVLMKTLKHVVLVIMLPMMKQCVLHLLSVIRDNTYEWIFIVMELKITAMPPNPLIVLMVRMKIFKYVAMVIILPMMKLFVLHLHLSAMDNSY